MEAIKKKELNAIEKLVDIMHQVSDKEYILKYDEHEEWMNEIHTDVAIVHEEYEENKYDNSLTLKKKDYRQIL